MDARSLTALGGVAFAAALAWWIVASDEREAVDAGRAGASAGAAPSAAMEPSLAERSPPAVAVAIANAAAPVPAAPVPAASTAPVAVVVVAPHHATVGEANDLTVSVGAGASEVGFTVQFDANVLQARAGNEGAWALGAGPPARFVAEIPEEADRVRVHSVAPGRAAGLPAGTVAIVTFHAVGPGTTSVLVSDVVVRDAAGRTMASAVSGANLQVTVEPAPPRRMDTVRERASLTAAPSDASQLGD